MWYLKREHHKFFKIYGVLLTFSPAAADTILAFLLDTKSSAEDYDLILTGDLGFSGSELLLELMKKEGVVLNNHNDCGMMIFDRKKQDVHSGGSGCGCSASVLCSYIFKKMQKTFIFGIKCAISHPKIIKNGIMNKTFLPVLFLWLCKRLSISSFEWISTFLLSTFIISVHYRSVFLFIMI